MEQITDTSLDRMDASPHVSHVEPLLDEIAAVRGGMKAAALKKVAGLAESALAEMRGSMHPSQVGALVSELRALKAAAPKKPEPKEEPKGE